MKTEVARTTGYKAERSAQIAKDFLLFVLRIIVNAPHMKVVLIPGINTSFLQLLK